MLPYWGWAWFNAFLFTQLCEMPVYAYALKAYRKKRADNAVTRPKLVFEEADRIASRGEEPEPGLDLGSAQPSPKTALWKCLLLGFGASAITHPFVWFFFPYWGERLFLPFWDGDLAGLYWSVTVPLAEIFAFTTEGLYLRALRVRGWLAWALLANAISFGLGLFSRELFGWP